MRTKLLAAAACAGTAALLATPASADAALWRGKTEQGRLASVRTGPDGMVTRVRIHWRAPCRPGRYVGGTGFVRPFDVMTPLNFRDRGTYRARLNNGFRARLTVGLNGRISRNLRRWSGSFRVRARILRRGRVVDTCRVRGVRWSARLRR
jgi:hypothetical protein